MRVLGCSWPAPSALPGDFGGVKGSGKPLLLAVISRAVPEPWPSDPGRAMPADDVAVGVLADQVVDEQVLGNDGIAFHAHHLGDVGDAAGGGAGSGGPEARIRSGGRPF